DEGIHQSAAGKLARAEDPGKVAAFVDGGFGHQGESAFDVKLFEPHSDVLVGICPKTLSRAMRGYIDSRKNRHLPEQGRTPSTPSSVAFPSAPFGARPR